MSDLDTNLNSASSRDVAALEEQVLSLQRLMQVVLVILLVINGCFTVFLWRQQRILGQQLAEARPVAQEWDTKMMPLLNNFIPALQNYSKTHPDINPLIDRYGLRQSVTGQPPATATAPPAGIPKK
jgi:hypothetical protein